MAIYQLKHIGSSFSHAAEHYDAHATLQYDILQRTIAEAGHYFSTGATLLDVGCGTGRFAELAMKWNWQVMQLDIAFGMCRKASTHGLAVNADVHALPFSNNSFDGVFSNLALQWFSYPQLALQEVYRLLKSGGRCVIAGFGPATLQELRQALMSVDNQPRLNTFLSHQQVVHTAENVGFSVTACRQEILIKYYADMQALMRHIKALGASNKFAGRKAGTRKLFVDAARYYEALRTAQGLPASWEVITLVLSK